MTTDSALTIRTADAAFHACRRGAATGALFLHGFGGDLQTWDGVWAAMGEALPALRYDLRGFGRSPAGGDDSFDHGDDLLAIVDALALPRCDLVGVSMGGSIALDFALDHPERVRRLVLISPGLVGWEWSAPWRARWRAIVEQARAGRMDEARRLWWQHPLFETTRNSAAGPGLWRSIECFAGAQWLRDGQRLRLPDVERLHQLAPPTLLLTGGRDVEDFRLIADLIEASASDLRRIDFPECGHLLQLERADACARHIVDFLGGA